LLPINLVVYKVSSSPEGESIIHLKGGFALICIQRLSLSNIATRPLPLA
jgi:hypothetical protein